MREPQVADRLLDVAASQLDIPPHKYREALERFDAIRRHLESGEYYGCRGAPEVYLQGSFRYGTVVRPIRGGEDCGFDIDIVCSLRRDKAGTLPAVVKNAVGREVRSYANRNGMSPPSAGRRCWSLDYAADSEGIGFHVDILPSLPDPAAGHWTTALNEGVGATANQYTQTTIALTHCDDPAEPQYNWRSSNPLGFAQWFLEISNMAAAFVDTAEEKRVLFESHRHRAKFPFSSPHEIPDALVRSPLQRAIQVLKRHRDLRFSGRSNESYKPITMIITTLAARLYELRERDLPSTSATLAYLADRLAGHARLLDEAPATARLEENLARLRLIERYRGRWYIPNPVNPQYPGDDEAKGENFADRWHEDGHARAHAFFEWAAFLKSDLGALRDSVWSDSGRALAGIVGRDASLATIRAASRANPATAAMQDLFAVSHRERPSWNQNLVFGVKLRGRALKDGVLVAESSNGLWHLPKRLDLEFQLKTNAPHPYDVYWQVVNTGLEAESASGLRGEIFRGGAVRSESTSYSGFHWIEALIVKSGRLVGRSGEFVVSIA